MKRNHRPKIMLGGRNMIYELYYDRSDNKFRHIQIGNIGKLGEIAIE